MFLFRIVTAGINPFDEAPAMTALDAATGGAASSLLNSTAGDDDDDDASVTLDGPAPGSPPRRQPRAVQGSSSLFSPLRRLFGSSAPSSAAPPRASTIVSDPTFSARASSAAAGARQLMPLPSSRIVSAGLTSASFAPLRRDGPGAVTASPLPPELGGPRRGRCACSPACAVESLRARCFAFCSSSPLGCACCVPLFRPPRVSLSALPLTPAQQERVASIRGRAAVAFDAGDEAHRSELYSFAVAAFGPGFTMQELFSSPRWASLGFQGRNPATDFRGAGLFGLQCLHYLVGLEPRVVRRMAQREHGSVLHYLPFAIAGLNLAFTLLQALQLAAPADAAADAAVLVTPTEAEIHLAFCALLAHEQFAFEEIFRSAMLYLEELWTDTHAQYTQFNSVLLAVRERVETALLRRPLSIGEFARLLQEGDDGEGLM